MRDQLVPVVEIHPNGRALGEPVFVPMHSLDSVVGELSDDFDFGLAQYQVQNPEELGKISVNLGVPKFAVDIQKGVYSLLKPAQRAVKRAPVLSALRGVYAAKKKPLVIARKKPAQSNSARAANLSQIYSELQRQGKIVNLLATKKQVTSEHDKRMAQDGFRQTVLGLLHKIEKQCAGDISGNYFARWNKLKNVTGVAVHQR